MTTTADNATERAIDIGEADHAAQARGVAACLENLPSPPWVAVEVLRISNDPDASVDELAGVLGRDPVLAARLLKVANSPSFASGREVTTLERATLLLGFKAVKLLALSFSLAPSPGETVSGFDLDRYWYHSLLNAVTAKYWAGCVDGTLEEEAFLSGLLSHLGRLILSRQAGPRYGAVCTGSTNWPSHDDEARIFGFHSAHVTHQVLHEWKLPQIIADSAGTMYLPRTTEVPTEGPALRLEQVLGLTVLTERVLSGADRDAYLELESRAFAIGVGPEELEDIIVMFESSVRELASSLDVTLPSDMSHERMLDEARTALVTASMETISDMRSVSATNSQLEVEAYQDRLTGVANRAAFDDHLEREITGALRAPGTVVGAIVMDIDHFKSFNDTYGHQTGDVVLRAVAAAMGSVVRSNEMLARYGGEEFALVIRDCTREAAEKAAERIRVAVEATTVDTEHGPLSVTISVGAAYDEITSLSDGDRLLGEADAALYRAKETGRNRVVVATRS